MEQLSNFENFGLKISQIVSTCAAPQAFYRTDVKITAFSTPIASSSGRYEIAVNQILNADQFPNLWNLPSQEREPCWPECSSPCTRWKRPFLAREMSLRILCGRGTLWNYQWWRTLLRSTSLQTTSLDPPPSHGNTRMLPAIFSPLRTLYICNSPPVLYIVSLPKTANQSIMAEKTIGWWSLVAN